MSDSLVEEAREMADAYGNGPHGGNIEVADLLTRLADRVDELEADWQENGLLREELWRQWHSNHDEHCSNTEWPHAAGEHCTWPLPDLLSTQPHQDKT